MDQIMRTPCQGVSNIVRFNWHFYVLAGALILASLVAGALLTTALFWLAFALAMAISVSIGVSLLVSFYVYDCSQLYRFLWLKDIGQLNQGAIANIHAGFDETSAFLKNYYAGCSLRVFDFYDPARHTEISIERARKAYAPFEGTIKITTDRLPLVDGSMDIIFNIFALHEVRNRIECIQFLKRQLASLDKEGRCVVVEHLRDVPNFLAYNIGFLHFLSEAEWIGNFSMAGLVIERQFKITSFITVFILKKNGNTH